MPIYQILDSLRWTSFINSCSKDIERKAEELPYQLEMADNKAKLKEVLVDQAMFNQLYSEGNKQELMKYWRFIGGYNIASQAYVTSLKEYLRVSIKWWKGNNFFTHSFELLLWS